MWVFFRSDLKDCVALFRSRRHLHDTKSKRYQYVSEALGGLYLQYDKKYWWWEIVIVLHKMIMTGAMCVVAQGSSAQLLIAVIVMLIYMLVVLKAAPFIEQSEDLSSFISCLCLTLTYVGGFALISEVDKRDIDGNKLDPTYEQDTLAYLLIGMNAICLIIEVAIFFIIDVGGCVGDLIRARRTLQNSGALSTTGKFFFLHLFV